MSALKVYVPRDAAALAKGANAVAAAIVAEAAARGVEVQVVRNGSRGLLWLETFVEVATNAGRVAYGPVKAADVAGLFDAGVFSASAAAASAAEGGHALCHGLTEAIPYFAKQQRLTFARVGITDPVCLEDYEAHGGLVGLRAALAMVPADIVQQVTDSGLRGRGGAAFPAGIKWKTVHDQQAPQKYITCNADEGDSGTFADRMLMEGDPYTLLEGMTIAGLATGATHGYIYLRAEYPHAHLALNEAIRRARAAGWLGASVYGSGRAFDIDVRLGAGAYICGEETSMLESLEGRRGEVRVRPPLPAIKGLFGCPTVVNNVITLASVPVIMAKGGAYYRDFGTGRSRGTLPMQLAGNLARGGLVELAFGCTIRELLEGFGGGSATGRPLRTVQIGGPLGAYVPAAQFDLPMDYEALAAAGALVGHGGLVAFDDAANLPRMARHALAFCAHESCGKCTPCRIGSTRGVELMDEVIAGQNGEANVALLTELLDTMQYGSLCGLGGMTPFPVRSLLQHFPEDFLDVQH